MAEFTLYNGDCLQVMRGMDANSVDAVITDPPYGTTACSWDSVIPFDAMWEGLRWVRKSRAAVVLFGSQPFTSALVMSNPGWFKYQWIWHKDKATGFLDALRRPLASYEDVNVFCDGQHIYNPQMRIGKMHRRGGGQTGPANIYGKFDNRTTTESDLYYPQRIIKFAVERRPTHPTQKPVALMEYLIKTYTNEGDTVLDFTMGSGTTGVAAMMTNRNFIGIELDPTYFQIAQERISRAQTIARGEFPTITAKPNELDNLPLFAEATP